MNQIFTIEFCPAFSMKTSGVGGPDALFFQLRKRIVAAATHVSGNERSDIGGWYNYFEFGSHSLGLKIKESWQKTKTLLLTKL
ncbi:hypothetical protein C0J27_04045 [Candidatus Chromulinivorax destructor]|uniref:Uncharacterized protein n=1 Tax=Candidatus Chromulinivorax destructor TaxID=2066483 RepID=A0A345ZC72_9BACT|nr:hypothetical protein C0J27_04045 [Candidatus Chromulinivorax destructor]